MGSVSISEVIEASLYRGWRQVEFAGRYKEKRVCNLPLPYRSAFHAIWEAGTGSQEFIDVSI